MSSSVFTKQAKRELANSLPTARRRPSIQSQMLASKNKRMMGSKWAKKATQFQRTSHMVEEIKVDREEAGPILHSEIPTISKIQQAAIVENKDIK